MTEREKAEEILKKHVKTEHFLRHSYAVEAVMRALSRKLEPENEEEWAIVGLLHDLDSELVDYMNSPELHGPKTVEILKNEGFGNDKIYHGILAHNQATKAGFHNKMDQAVFAADPITGFINAITLVYIDKKIDSVKVKSITKRMKETRFAAGADRDAMKSIEKLGISFPDFAEISLNAMKEISQVLGL
ncbi:MAG: HD domain-containing protein [Solirubrobacterales bacterium]